jgi:hypothetical protein
VDALKDNADNLLDGDGHTLMSAGYYLDFKVPEVFVCPYYRWNEAGQGKYAIFVDGETVEGLYGIHNLDWLYGIAKVLDAKYQSYGGRGFQARGICKGIEEALELLEPVETTTQEKET